MKTWMKVVLGIFGGIAVLLGFIFWLTGDVVEAGDKFFAEVQAENIDGAYDLLSEDFQATTSKAELQIFLKDSALTNVTETSWGSRSIENNRATLQGSVTTEKGGVIPLTLKFVNTDSGWKIYNIQKQTAGISDSGSDQIPSAEKQVVLANTSVAAFVDAAAAQSMQGFYEHISYMWQQQITAAKMNELYGPFFPFEKDLLSLKQTPVKITKPAFVNKDGALEMEFEYRNENGLALFTGKYVYEGLGWKLIGFFAELR